MAVPTSPLAAAQEILFSHPAVTVVDAAAEPIVRETIDNAAGLRPLATEISAQGPVGPGGWARLVDAGVVGGFPAQVLVLSERTRRAAVAGWTEVIQATQTDPRLEEVLWFPHPGEAGGYRPVQTLPPYAWTVAGIGTRSGLTVPSVAADPATGAFRVQLGNRAPRVLAAYLELLDAAGKPVPPAGWVSRLPAGVDPAFETATTKYLGLVPPTARSEGIAVPSHDAVLTFAHTQGAAEVRVWLGSLGAEPWDPVAGPLGAVLTAVLGWAVPAVLAAAGVAPGTWYGELLGDPEVQTEVMQAASFLRGIPDLAAVLAVLEAQIGPLLYGGALPKLTAALLQQMSAEELAGAATTVPWATTALAATLAPAAAWSLLSTPSVFPLRLSAHLVGDLRVDLRADPAAGAWPAAAQSYAVSAVWDGGSGRQAGAASGLLTPSPLPVVFPAVPANRTVALVAEVTAEGGRVCARGSAQAPAGAGAPRRVDLTLAQERPALTTSTRYGFRQVLAWNAAAGHHWATGPAPTATRKDLNGGSSGHHLAALGGLQLGAAGRLLGSSWQASGQNLPLCGSHDPTDGQINTFQTLGALAAPQEGLQFPSCGLSVPSLIAFGPAGAGLDVWLDPRQGGLRARRFTPGQPFDMSLTAPSAGRFPVPHLDDLVIHPAGFAVAVSFGTDSLAILVLGPGTGEREPMAGLSGGTGEEAGRFRGPVALAPSPGGDLLVLETLNRRIQAVDVHGNPIPYFPAGRPFLPLRAESAPVTYLDLEVDAEGYLYVLLFLNQGEAVADYRLDLYRPDGTFLAATPGFNAARIAVDAWRNLYTLNYSLLLGPGGRTEPTLNLWIPRN